MGSLCESRASHAYLFILLNIYVIGFHREANYMSGYVPGLKQRLLGASFGLSHITFILLSSAGYTQIRLGVYATGKSPPPPRVFTNVATL